MKFDWKEYLEIAERLHQEGGEAQERAAIGRAYYAAFCSARNWLKNDETIEITRSTSHATIWKYFSPEGEKHTPRQKKQIARLGDNLRECRNAADYDNEMINVTEKSKDAIAHARTILKLLAELDRKRKN